MEGIKLPVLIVTIFSILVVLPLVTILVNLSGTLTLQDAWGRLQDLGYTAYVSADTGDWTVGGHVIPDIDNTYNIGSTTSGWRTQFLRTSLVLQQSTADYTLTWDNPAAARAISFGDPGGTDKIVYLAATQALTNKTYNGLTVSSTTKTLTLNGDLVTSGGFNLTLTLTGNTNVTLPTTGTLQTTTATIGAQYGGTGVNSASSTGIPYVISGTWAVDGTKLYSDGGDEVGINTNAPSANLHIKGDNNWGLIVQNHEAVFHESGFMVREPLDDNGNRFSIIVGSGNGVEFAALDDGTTTRASLDWDTGKWNWKFNGGSAQIAFDSNGVAGFGPTADTTSGKQVEIRASAVDWDSLKIIKIAGQTASLFEVVEDGGGTIFSINGDETTTINSLTTAGNPPFKAGSGFWVTSTDTGQAIIGSAYYNGSAIIAGNASSGLLGVAYTTGNGLQFFYDTGLTPGASFVPTERFRVAADGLTYTSVIQVGGTVGTPATNNQISTGSLGAGSATLYIGNASINVTPSDARMKDNIRPFSANAKDWLTKANRLLREWEWGDLYQERKGQFQVGFVAQEMLKFAPEMVVGGNDGNMYGFNYALTTPYLIAGFADHEKRLQALEAKQ